MKSKTLRGILTIVFALMTIVTCTLGMASSATDSKSVYYMIPVRQGSRYGYLQYQKSMGSYNVQIPLSQRFSDVKPFAKNGLAPAKNTTNGQYGYVDRKGNWVIQPVYPDASTFADNGLANVQDPKTEKWGYINSKGNWVIRPVYNKAYPFADGLALVLKDWNFYFINSKNQKQFNVSKDYNYDLPQFCNGYFVVRTDRGAGYMDTKGKLIVNPESSKILRMGPFYSNGSKLVAVAEDRYGAWGYIGTDGKWAIHPSRDLEGADRFGTNGLAPAVNSGSYGFIDTQYDQRATSDRFRIKPQFRNVSPFYEGGFAAVQKKNGKWGVINSRGKYVVPAEYDAIGEITKVTVYYHW